MKTIEIDPALLTYLQTKATTTGEPISETMRRELKIAPPTVPIEIEDDVYNYLLSKATSIGEPASNILAREIHFGSNHPAGDVVEFHIKAGTGSQPWNSAETIVTAKVGNVLRIVNKDSVAHRPHTDGGAPFPHPASEIPPGGQAQFTLQVPFGVAPGQTPAIYDHVFGQTARFWIKVENP